MIIAGRIQNGVVVLEGDAVLPEGAPVTVSYSAPNRREPPGRRIDVPLIHTGRPGSVALTGAQIAELLDQEDASSGH